MSTDIAALHELYEKREQGCFLPRRCGKTYLRCHELAGLIGVEAPKDIIVVMTVLRDFDYLVHMMCAVFREHEFQVSANYQRRTMTVGHTILRFFTEEELSVGRHRGIAADTFFVRHND